MVGKVEHVRCHVGMHNHNAALWRCIEAEPFGRPRVSRIQPMVQGSRRLIAEDAIVAMGNVSWVWILYPTVRIVQWDGRLFAYTFQAGGIYKKDLLRVCVPES